VSLRGSWRPLAYPGVPGIVRWSVLTVQALVVYVAASRGVGYLVQPPVDGDSGSLFTAVGIDVLHPALWGTMFTLGAALIFTGHVLLSRPILSAAGHGLIAIAYLALGWYVVVVNPLNAGLFVTGLIHLAYVAALGSSIGTARGVARQTEG
jgi:hypothetical protein